MILLKKEFVKTGCFTLQFNYQTSTSGASSDRLKKAIARNRAKQSKRSTKVTPKSATRVSVARSANDQTFATPLKRPKKKKLLSNPFSYKTKVKAKPAVRKTRKRKYSVQLPSWALKLAWIACAVLMVRLLFSDRGVFDYYSRNNDYKGQISEYEGIIQENNSLRSEIDKIKSNQSYQKKLVRDHLGFISKDEFLILFAKEKSDQAI